jgi:hypothetical protein
MTVQEMKSRMSYEEYCKWAQYFDKFPPEWRSDLRTFYLLSQQSKDKMDAASIFPSLKPIFNRKPSGDLVANLKGTLMHSKMLQAVGGDKLEFL